MDRNAVFIDAGYFWVQISQILFGEKRRRVDIDLNPRLMRESLLRQVKRISPETRTLRIYWYDGLGPNGLPTEQHKEIGRLADIKLRYGTVNSAGQQKGVDGLLMADLIALSQNRAIVTAVICSGDADLVPGINDSQMLGVRVHRLGIHGPGGASPILCEEVDDNSEWPIGEIMAFIRPAPDSPPPLPRESKIASELEEISREFAASLDDAQRAQIGTSPFIPPELDKKLLFHARTRLGRQLDNEEAKALRDVMRMVVGGKTV